MVTATRADRIAVPTSEDATAEPRSPEVVNRTTSVGDDDDELLFGPPPWWDDIKAILSLAIPAAATQLFRVCNVSVVLIMCGHLSPPDFAGLSLGQSLTNIFVTSPGIGFSTMLDTLVTQEFGRDPTSPLMGLHLRRAMIAGIIWLTGSALVFLVIAEPFCVAMFGEEAGVAASKYLRLGFLPSIPMICQTCIQKFLSAQGIVDVAFWAQAASIITLIASLSIAVPYGLSAVALAACVGRLTSLGVCIILGRRRPGVMRTWGVWSPSEVLNKAEFKAFVKHAMPSVLTTCAERWTFDTLTVLTGLLGVVSSGAWGILLNVWIVLFSPCVGFYTANSTLVGNSVGAGRPYAARRYAHRVFVLQVCTQLGLCGVLWQWPHAVLWFYANSPDVIAVAAAIAPVLSIAVFSDTTSYALLAALRGAGDLRFVAWLTLFAQWGMSFTISAALMSTWWSISAVATGVALGSSMQLMGLSVRLQGMDWLAVVRKRHHLVQNAADDESTALNDSMSIPHQVESRHHEERGGTEVDDEIEGDEELGPITTTATHQD